MKQETKKLKNEVYAAYVKDGGYSRALEIANKSGQCDYEYCAGCECEMPVIKGTHECLICGQTTTPINEHEAVPLGGEGLPQTFLPTRIETYVKGETWGIQGLYGNDMLDIADSSGLSDETADTLTELVKRYNAYSELVDVLEDCRNWFYLNAKDKKIKLKGVGSPLFFERALRILNQLK